MQKLDATTEIALLAGHAGTLKHKRKMENMLLQRHHCSFSAAKYKYFLRCKKNRTQHRNLLRNSPPSSVHGEGV